MQYKLAGPLSVPLKLLIPEYTEAVGVPTKVYPDPENGILIYGTFRTFGGTEREVNGVYSVENTATVETWYRPDIRSNCRIVLVETGEVYDILGEPENIGMRNQYLRMRLLQVKGGA